MYRYESDYIMRMIHLLRLLYEHLLGITDQDMLQLGEDRLRETMGKLTGLTPDAALAMDMGQIRDMLGSDGEGLSRFYALAELMRMQGELYERISFPEDAVPFLRKAMLLYFETARAPRPLCDDAVVAASPLFHRFFADLTEREYLLAGQYFEQARCYADAEDAYCAMEDARSADAFYRRLLSLSPDAIEQGGLSFGEAHEGFRRIARILGDAPDEDGAYG